jgi:Zn-dependent protease
MVAIAGPLSNFVLAGLTWLVINQVDQTKTGFSLQFLYFFLIYNLLLGLFNLMPFPPLDGSNMVKSILRGRLLTLYMLLEPIIFIAFLLLIFSGELGNVIRPWLEFLILKMSSM